MRWGKTVRHFGEHAEVTRRVFLKVCLQLVGGSNARSLAKEVEVCLGIMNQGCKPKLAALIY